MWPKSKSTCILSTKMNGPLAQCHFFTSHTLPLQQSLPQQIPNHLRYSGLKACQETPPPFPAEASAPLKVPKDGKLIRGSAVGFKSREKDPVLKKNTKEIQIKKNCLSSSLISYHKSGQIDLSVLLPENPFHKVSSLHFQTGFSFLSY